MDNRDLHHREHMFTQSFAKLAEVDVHITDVSPQQAGDLRWGQVDGVWTEVLCLSLVSLPSSETQGEGQAQTQTQKEWSRPLSVSRSSKHLGPGQGERPERFLFPSRKINPLRVNDFVFEGGDLECALSFVSTFSFLSSPQFLFTSSSLCCFLPHFLFATTTLFCLLFVSFPPHLRLSILNSIKRGVCFTVIIIVFTN